jgi:carboxyl-terminal processing protease
MVSARLALLLVPALVACSARSSSPGEPPRRDSTPSPPAVVEVPPPDPREVKLAEAIVALLENEHLRRRPLDDELSRAAFKTYLERLDASKMFLLRSHATELGRFADAIDDQLRSGRLELAHAGARVFAGRVAVVDQLVTDLLAAPLDHTDEEWLELDPKKVELAETEEELRDRWRRRLELEILERVAGMETRLAGKENKAGDVAAPSPGPGALDEEDEGPSTAPPVDQIPKTAEGRDAKAREDLARAYSGRFARLRTPGPLSAAATLVNAVAATYDPHTVYLPAADKANFDIQMSGSLEGIGAVLRERDHYVEIVELVPGGASWREGRLAPGDLILAVGNKGKPVIDVADMRLDEVVKMIRGPKGTTVTLRVRKATGEEESIAITRDVVVIEEAYARGAILSPDKDGKRYGYIFLPSFYGGQGSGRRTAARDVQKLLERMKREKVAGVVIDVRSNGGGYLGDAVEMTGLLIDRGPVVQVQDSGGRRQVLADERPGTSYDGPVVVLVDRFSASASEIVAGAVKDYRRGVIIGTGPTHGKGTVQSLADLDGRRGRGGGELGVLKITIQQFFRVSGSSTQREGVKPDIVLPDPLGHVESGERELEHAIPWTQIDAAPYTAWRAMWKHEDLSARSATRVAGHPDFTKILARSELLRVRRDDTRVPLARPAWEERRKTQRAQLEATTPDLAKSDPRMSVKLLDEEAAKKLAPGPGGRVDDRATRWRDNLARDIWVEESLFVLRDMGR